MTTSTPGEGLCSWAVWVRRGRGCWRLYGRAASEQAAEALSRKVPLGLDKLLLQGDRDPNADGKRETSV
jgi:hypothetical protein